MNLKYIGITALLALGVCGCGGPGAGPQSDSDHWLSKVPVGMSADQAHQVLADNGFRTWSAGRIMYGYRDKVASSDYSNGVSMEVRIDSEGHVASAEAYSSPVSPYPILAPVYP